MTEQDAIQKASEAKIQVPHSHPQATGRMVTFVELLEEIAELKQQLATLRARAETAEAEHGDRASERDSAYYSIDQIAEALNVDLAAGDGSLSPVMEKIKEVNAIAAAAHAWRTARLRCLNSNTLENFNAYANAKTDLMAALDGARGVSNG